MWARVRVPDASKEPVELQNGAGCLLDEHRVERGQAEPPFVEVAENIVDPRRVVVQRDQRQLDVDNGNLVECRRSASEHFDLEALNVELEIDPIVRSQDLVAQRVQGGDCTRFRRNEARSGCRGRVPGLRAVPGELQSIGSGQYVEAGITARNAATSATKRSRSHRP